MPGLPAFAELHCLSNFTFLTGASHPEELVARARELGYAALAVTDECSLAGVVRAHAAAKECGLPLIVGSEIRLADGPRLVFLAGDREGYGNLAELITLGRRRAAKGRYRLERGDLESGLGGCLALWLADEGSTAADGAWLRGLFSGRAWLAAALHRTGGDCRRLRRLRDLGAAAGLPLVAVGSVLMHARERQPLQDVLTAIRLNRPVHRAGHALQPNAERHLRSRKALGRFYPGDLLAETLRVAGHCRFSLDELRYEYPDELVPAGLTPAAHLRRLTEEGMKRRWPGGAPDRVRGLVEHELALIAELGYEPYFLTVHDVVRFARQRGILCQGRGSAANSAVCYCLGITEVDPARMAMLFERFISRERNEPPDIDVDFEHQRREEVLQYIYEKYGRHRAALAATVITYRPKSAVRDVGKALGLAPDQVDRLAGSIAWWDGREIANERLREAGLDPASPVIRRVMALVQEIQGFPRHLSQHVGGMVISRGPVSRLVPVENAAMAGRTVIQWDKDDLDDLGLLKVDCLALGMLSAIRRTFDLVNDYYGWKPEGRSDFSPTAEAAGCRAEARPTGGGDGGLEPLGMHNIPPEDPDVYAMIQRAETTGVFQIESRAQMAMLPRLRPACFYDLVIEVAIVRPGPIQGNMVHPYLRRRQGLEAVEYPSEEVKDVLGRTLGVPIFQEQVIRVAQVAAGFSPGEADRLRRSIGAWRRRGTLEQFERRLVDGMKARGYAEPFARQIYQQILGFGEYGFPESHAASFALLVYVSAWLKHHHPAAFFAALINSQPMGFYAPAQLIREARRQDVTVRPVDVRFSGRECSLERPFALAGTADAGQGRSDFSPTAEAAGRRAEARPTVASAVANGGRRMAPILRLGLCLVKGLSHEGGERVEAARGEGPFTSVDDLARRARLDRGDLKALAAAGALRGLAGDRHQAAWQVMGHQPELPLFGAGAEDEIAVSLPLPTRGQDIVADYGSLGLSLAPHPLALLRGRLDRAGLVTAADVRRLGHGAPVSTGGIVINRQHPASARGVIFITLEDETGHVNLVVWRQVAQRQRRVLLGACLMAVKGEVQREGEVVHVVARRLFDYSRLLGALPTRSRDFR